MNSEQVVRQDVESEKNELIPDIVKLYVKDDRMDVSYDGRINTTSSVDVYSDTRVERSRKTSSLSPNDLIKYQREVIRHGRDLVMLKDKNNNKLYIEKDLSKFSFCRHCEVQGRALHCILMSHAEYDKYSLSKVVNRYNLKMQKAPMPCSIEIIDDVKVVSTFDVVDIKEGETTVKNVLLFRNDTPELRFGRISPFAKFFIVNKENEKTARKIKLADGTEAILLSLDGTFKEQIQPIMQVVNVFVMILTIAICLGIIIFTALSIGYIIIIGAVIIAIAYALNYIVGVPLFYLIYNLSKRL